MSEIQQQISNLRKEFYNLAKQSKESNDVLIKQFETFSIILCEQGFTTEQILNIIKVWSRNQEISFSDYTNSVLFLLGLFLLGKKNV